MSHAKSLMSRGQGLCSYALEILAARMTDPKWDMPSFESLDMTRGIELEQYAGAAFTEITGKKYETVGFIESDCGNYGASPDGINFDDGFGLEIKCPRAHKHLSYLDKEVALKEHGAQIQGNLLAFPAPAGMNRKRVPVPVHRWRVPRTRGDEPPANC